MESGLGATGRTGTPEREGPLSQRTTSSGGFRDRYGAWAVVAGASEGLGAAFADQIASRGLNLVLVARRAAKLESLCESLVARHGVEARALPLDLADSNAPVEVEKAAEGLEVHASGIRRSELRPRWSGALLGCLLLADLHGLATAVPAAVRAGVVGALGLVAVRALLQIGDRERVM